MDLCAGTGGLLDPDPDQKVGSLRQLLEKGIGRPPYLEDDRGVWETQKCRKDQ